MEEYITVFEITPASIDDRKPFAANGLRIKVNCGGQGRRNTWHYGDEPEDLGGTARTLDLTDGPDVINGPAFFNASPVKELTLGEVPIEHGVISRNGFSLVDDGHSMVLTKDGWIEPRDSGIIDIYFFGYGHQYLKCLKYFYYLCRKTPLLPRYGLASGR